jgi:hypothetical protein
MGLAARQAFVEKFEIREVARSLIEIVSEYV